MLHIYREFALKASRVAVGDVYSRATELLPLLDLNLLARTSASVCIEYSRNWAPQSTNGPYFRLSEDLGECFSAGGAE